MYSDLDFAEAELSARGVCLDCFTAKNPLLIRPEQKLGRVLAAQSIINEMIEMDKEPTPQEVLAHSPNLNRTPRPSRSLASEIEGEPQETSDLGELESTNPLEYARPENHTGSNTQRTDYTDDEYQADDDQEEMEDEDTDNNPPVSISGTAIPETKDDHERDSEAESELVSMLDDSLSNFPRIQSRLSEHIRPTEDENNKRIDSARTDTSNQSTEYDTNNFDADEIGIDVSGEARGGDDENQCGEVVRLEEAGEKEAKVEQEAEEDDEDDSLPEQTENCNADVVDDANPSMLSSLPPLSNEIEANPEEENHNLDEAIVSPRKQLLDELQSWARAHRSSKDLLVDLPDTLEWQSAENLEQAVHDNSSPVTALSSSILWALTETQLIPPHQQLASFLESNACGALNIRRLLRRESHLIVSSICHALSQQLQQALERENPLVSEIEMSDVLEIAESTFRKQDDSMWKYLGVATSLLTPAYVRGDVDEKGICPGLNELVNVFYPYLTSQSLDKLPYHWRALSRLFTSYFLRLSELSYALQPTMKGLLLIVASFTDGRVSDFSDGIDDAIFVPKLSVVCNRGDVLRTSVEVIWNKRLSAEPTTPHAASQIFPFYRSPFGEKVVDGARVEEGEGRGPLKEWFSLLGAELTSKWSPISLDNAHIDLADGGGSYRDVTVNGNRLQVPPPIAHLLHSGLKAQWITNSDLEPSGTSVICIVNKQDSSGPTGAFLLDRVVSPSTFDVSQLNLSEPRTPVFEYVQASESFFLNLQTVNEAFTHHTLLFVGWLLASAIVHTCPMNLRVHPLVFTMLLHRDYNVSLEDVRALDPSLGTSFDRIKAMPAQDLASLLELEGANPTMSADEYISSVLESTYGSKSSLAWQLKALRLGFNAVIPLDSVLRLAITSTDLAEIICGSESTTADTDFNIRHVFRVAADVDFTACTPLQREFWSIADGFEPAIKRKLVKFITGVDTLPLPGTEVRGFLVRTNVELPQV